jgi:hypothetical protein
MVGFDYSLIDSYVELIQRAGDVCGIELSGRCVSFTLIISSLREQEGPSDDSEWVHAPHRLCKGSASARARARARAARHSTLRCTIILFVSLCSNELRCHERNLCRVS